MKSIWRLCGYFIAAIALGGCAFDIVHVRQTPVTFSRGDTQEGDFTLLAGVTASIGTGFPTRLKAATRWHCVGKTEHGSVFSTRDQVVTVEASNIHEAYLVVSGQQLTGFYLPVEKKFVATKKPIPLEIQSMLSPQTTNP